MVSMVKGCIDKLPFHQSKVPDFLSSNGECYEVDKDIGDGYYWYYEKENMFALSVMSLKAKEDYITEYIQPNFISVNYYDTISAEELNPYKKLCANCIRGHVSNGELYRARFHKNIPIKGTELILMPYFYHDYIETKYPGVFPNPESAFQSIDGSIDFPELVLLLKQIGKFNGSGVSADLYFESKIIEALSLIIERTKREDKKKIDKTLTIQDMKNLEAVKEYIEDHFAYEIKADQLTEIACMGQTKLRSSFKQAYNNTITEYIQNRRITHAEFLLLNTDFNIALVAEAVGYHHAGRFSALFKQSTGLFPEEYRKLMK